MHKLLILLPILLTACGARVVSYEDVENVALKSLNQVQARSIRERREYCGWVIYDGEEVRSTQIRSGHDFGCEMPRLQGNVAALASFHTHAEHNADYYSEVPSELDILGDLRNETFGFVSTPSGRVWVVDPYDHTINQVCEVGCLAQDPNYNAAEVGYIPPRFPISDIYYYFR